MGQRAVSRDRYGARHRFEQTVIPMPGHRRRDNSWTALHLTEHPEADCETVSQFIRDRFARDHDAHLTHLMPRLFSIAASDGEMIAAFGLREAAAPLFMECYLDEPVEDRISRLSGRRVRREAIIEVGNMAARLGGARAMITALTAHLHAAGFEWVTFTGVATLRAAFRRLGLHPIEIAAARPERLSETERQSWGRYFESKPIVMAGYVPHGYQVLIGRAMQHHTPHSGGGEIQAAP